jgi:trehalose 6-phosphate phosphatase
MHDALAGLPTAARQLIDGALHARPCGLFSDVDGTLSALAPTPGSAVLLPGVRELLIEARGVFAVVAAVSGRAATDLRRLVDVEAITYIGNHGFDRIEPDGTFSVLEAAEPYREAVATTADRLGRALMPRFPGMFVEPKGATASIHTRGASDPAAADEAVYAAALVAAGEAGLRVTRGKFIVELRPPVAVDKGVAVAEAIRLHGLRGALYLGDDRTDIDAFRALRRLTAEGVCRGAAVAVLHEETPPGLAEEADVTLASIAEVPGFLRAVIGRSRAQS